MPAARALALLFCVLSACTPPQYPGEPVGSFDVVGRLEDNECGTSAVPALDPLTFAVELRERQGEAFWRRPDFPVVSGTVRDGSYRFRNDTRVVVIAADPDPDFGHPGCTLVQTEVVEVVLHEEESADAGAVSPDAGAETSMRLEGTSTIDLVPEPGSDCVPATVIAGGPFLALPCGIDYTLDGTARDGL